MHKLGRMLLATVVMVGVSVTTAAGGASAAPVTSPMTCSGGPGGGLRYSYTVTGTATMPDIPSGIAVTLTSGASSYLVLSSPAPVLDNSYGGGYWLRTYGLNAWNLGTASTTTYWLLLPSTTFGVLVSGQLHTVYAAGGYNTSGLACTLPNASGNTGPFSGVGGSRYTAVKVTGVITDPTTPTSVTVMKTYYGTTVIAGANPALDNSYGGGYWKKTYHWNSWNLGSDTAGNSYWLLIPDTRVGTSFAGQLQIVYPGAGNNQIGLALTITP